MSDNHRIAENPERSFLRVLQDQIPSGHHVILLSWMPGELALGIGLPAISGLVLAVRLVLRLVSRRRVW
jgi:hypothetical protein